jgi:hypothetical protein
MEPAESNLQLRATRCADGDIVNGSFDCIVQDSMNASRATLLVSALRAQYVSVAFPIGARRTTIHAWA